MKDGINAFEDVINGVGRLQDSEDKKVLTFPILEGVLKR